MWCNTILTPTPMSDTTMRERFEKEFMQDGELLMCEWPDDAIDIMEFIDSEIALAEQRWREEMKKEILERIPKYEWRECFWSEANELWEGMTNEIRTAIQSIK